jgi:mRNA interferase HigB
VRVIAKPALIQFWKKHPDAEKALLIWYKLVRQNQFSDFADLKKTFSTIDAADNFIIFDIGGNKFRIIARVVYKLNAVYIRNVFTHQEYDTWKADDDPWSKKGQKKLKTATPKKPKKGAKN